MEVIAAALLLIGWQATAASLVLLAVIIVAFVGVQDPQGAVTSFQRDLLILTPLLLLLTPGPGHYSVDHKKQLTP